MRFPWQQEYRDPITGDTLTLGERGAWLVTGFVRRWVVFFAIQLVAVLWLSLGDDSARAWYNYVWSDWAIVIENVTMLALFNQTRRDAVVTRKILAMEERQREIAERQREHLAAVQEHVETMREHADTIERLERLLCERLGVEDP